MNVATVAKRAGLAAAAFWGLAGGATAGLWFQLFRRPLPRTTGHLRVAGIESVLEVSRDRWGVPHVRAESDLDLWFGQGFCHGQDRLWQIDLYRRIGSGRLAEIAGTAGVVTDRFTRTLGLRRVAQGEVAELAPEIRSRLDAYCAGVNAAAARSSAAGGVPDSAPAVRAVRPRRCPDDDEAPLIRTLDQLGAGAAAGRDDARARPRARRPPGSRLSAGKSGGRHARRRLER